MSALSPPKDLEVNDFLSAYEMEITAAVPISVNDVVIDHMYRQFNADN